MRSSSNSSSRLHHVIDYSERKLFIIFFVFMVEQQFLNGSRQFTKSQERYIRCRLRKKLRILNEELAPITAAAAATLQRSCNGPTHTTTNIKVENLSNVLPTIHESKRKAEDLQQLFFARRRTTFSRLCKASAFLLQRVHWSKSKV